MMYLYRKIVVLLKAVVIKLDQTKLNWNFCSYQGTRIPGYQDTRIPGYHDIMISGYQDTRILGYQDTWIPGY